MAKTPQAKINNTQHKQGTDGYRFNIGRPYQSFNVRRTIYIGHLRYIHAKTQNKLTKNNPQQRK